MIVVVSNNSPETVLTDQLAQLEGGVGSENSFAVDYMFQQYFLDSKPEIHLLAVFKLVRSSRNSVCVFVGITDKISAATKLIEAGESQEQLSEQLRFPVLELSEPVMLKPLSIAKPWGQEIWYTGIEARGQSSVTDGRFETPLSWWLSVAGYYLAADKQQSINLLKILDPLPEEIYGDLYFELHEKKREVYVVTHIDEQAWPAGEGAIRFGFNQSVRSQYKDDEEFRSAYLSAVQHYEVVRREIDAIFDRKREQQNIALNAPVSASQLKEWHKQLPEELQQSELVCRQAMNHFSDLKPLKVGDVVKVPCLTPHALQHGVRTVEFQTPVYERKILSFAQKVLTQSGWDTSESVNLMMLDKPKPSTLELLEQTEDLCFELVVNFDDFRVFRVSLQENAQWSVPATGEYALLMDVCGEVVCGKQALSAEQALFLPASRESAPVTCSSKGGAVLLFAEPC